MDEETSGNGGLSAWLQTIIGTAGAAYSATQAQKTAAANAKAESAKASALNAIAAKWPWIVGGVAVLVLALVLIRRK